jgi:hypothetical protein
MDDLIVLAGRGGAGGAAGGTTTTTTATTPADKLSLTAALLNGVALRSYAGGNVSAALARFEATRDALGRVLEELGKEQGEEGEGDRHHHRRKDAAAARVALATALGCIGDCQRRSGHETAAEASYRDAAERLSVLAGVGADADAAATAAANENPQAAADARRGLGVTLGKLGDLAYARGDVAAAFREYSRVLELRRGGGGGGGDDASAAADARLDLASALIKAGDAAENLPQGAADVQPQPPQAPSAYFAEARALLEEELPPGGDDKAREAKRRRFLEALEAAAAAAAGGGGAA